MTKLTKKQKKMLFYVGVGAVGLALIGVTVSANKPKCTTNADCSAGQQCVSGECVPITDPCQNIVCTNYCKGYDLWSRKCVNGVCVDNVLIQSNSTSCGYIPPGCTSDSQCTPDGWVDNGITQWISATECTNKQQKQQEYRNYYCNPVDHTCKYSVTTTQWIDTGSTQNKPNGTACTNGTCQNGVCVTADPCSGIDCGPDTTEDTGQRQVIDYIIPCWELEQALFNIVNHYCEGGICKTRITGQQWFNFGIPRKKANGATCQDGLCLEGQCILVGYPGTNFPIDTWLQSPSGMDYDGSSFIIADSTLNKVLIINATNGSFEWLSPQISSGMLLGVTYVTPNLWIVDGPNGYTNLYKYSMVNNTILETYDLEASGMVAARGVHAYVSGGVPFYLYVLDGGGRKIYKSSILSTNYRPGDFSMVADLSPITTYALNLGLVTPQFRDLWVSITGYSIYITDSANNCVWTIDGDWISPQNIPDRPPHILIDPVYRTNPSKRGIALKDGSNYWIADAGNPEGVTAFNTEPGTYF